MRERILRHPALFLLFAIVTLSAVALVQLVFSEGTAQDFIYNQF
ncbi:MAG: hypothetical protein WCQ50_13735 [Spirochaetota bacterium]